MDEWSAAWLGVFLELEVPALFNRRSGDTFSAMFTDIRDVNVQVLEDDAQRRAAIHELATVPSKGAENRARRKAMKAAIDERPPFRRITGPATRLHVKATPRASLNDAIGQQILTFNPGRPRRDRPRTQAERPGVDGRARRQVEADRREAVARDGLDASTDRRLPRLRRRGSAVRDKETARGGLAVNIIEC